jgi:hypothetical protein
LLTTWFQMRLRSFIKPRSLVLGKPQHASKACAIGTIR